MSDHLFTQTLLRFDDHPGCLITNIKKLPGLTQNVFFTTDKGFWVAGKW